MKKVGIGFAILLVVLLVVRIGIGMYSSSKFTAYDIAWANDVKLERTRAASVRRPVRHGLAPLESNAAALYSEVFAAKESLTGSPEVAAIASAVQGTAVPPELAKTLADHASELAALREAVRCTRCDWEFPWERAIAAPLPNILVARHLTNVMVLEGRTLAPREAVARALDVVRIGSDFEVGPALIHRMIGIAIMQNGFKALAQTIVRAKPGELDLDAIAADLAKVDAERPSVIDAIRGERLSIHSFVGPGAAGAAAMDRTPDALGGRVILELGAIELDGLEREVEAALALQGAERDKALDEVEKKALDSWNPIVKIAVPNFKLAVQHMEESTAALHAVETVIAAEKARGADGTYPESIAGIDSSVRYLRSPDGKGWTISAGRLSVTR